jgi:hypothetical protein
VGRIEGEVSGAMISAEFTDYSFGRPVEPNLFSNSH